MLKEKYVEELFSRLGVLTPVELASRFDFRDSGASFALEGREVLLEAPAEFQLKQMLDILRLKLSKRGIDLACLDVQPAEVNLARARQKALLREGLDADNAKLLQRALKDSKLKVQAAIQGDKLRVTGKSRDELQAAIALVKRTPVELPLQFNNFRD